MNFYTMGVINITPNSFSDGGKFNDPQNFKRKFIDLCGWADIIDVGAESTAPFNQKVSENDELSRFEQYFYPLLKELSDPKKVISIDTYKVAVFKSVYLEIKNYWPQTKVIFNDVSGVIDEELLKLLKEQKDLTYVFSHNLVTTRNDTSDHMSLCSKKMGEEFLKEYNKYFEDGLKGLEEFNVWVDPCFGFAKTREQNHLLLKNMPKLLECIPADISVVYGISRKSFLRFPAELNIKEEKNKNLVDQMQVLLIKDLLEQCPKRKFIFRVHDENSLAAIKNVKKIFEI